MNYDQYFTTNELLLNRLQTLISDKKYLSILEPSCGKCDILNYCFNESDLKNIICYEIDKSLKNKIIQCSKNKYNIIYTDFLTAKISKKFDLIIGNPPFTYTLEFIDKCIDLLDKNGELLFIIQKVLFEQTRTKNLLSKMKKLGSFTHYIKFNNTNLFKNANVSVVIFKFKKDIFQNYLYYAEDDNEFETLNYRINNILVIDKNNDLNKVMLNSLFNIYVGYVSGADKELKINEKDNSLENFKCIIKIRKNLTDYDYYFDCKNENEAIKYNLNKSKLIKRGVKKFNDNNWFEFGLKRNEKIINSNLNKPCIYILSKTRKDIKAIVGKVEPFGGNLIMLLPKNDNINLNNICDYLNSDEFANDYITDGNRFSITSNILNNINIPNDKSDNNEAQMGLSNIKYSNDDENDEDENDDEINNENDDENNNDNDDEINNESNNDDEDESNNESNNDDEDENNNENNNESNNESNNDDEDENNNESNNDDENTLYNKIINNICNYLKHKNINLINNNSDGRINSSISENKVIEEILKFKKYKYYVPKDRHWFDIAVILNDNEYIPINIKITTMKSSDNACSLTALLYSLTDLNISIDKFKFTDINLLFDNISEINRDYYFIVLNKNNNEIIFNSIKQLPNLTWNSSNLPFQINWGKNKIRKLKTTSEFMKYYINLVKNNYKPTWKETFINKILNENENKYDEINENENKYDEINKNENKYDEINENENTNLESTKHFSTSSLLIDSIDLSIFNNEKVIEPFVGDGDLLKLCKIKNYECYDICIPKNKNLKNFKIKDTLLNNVFVNNSDSYVITNPPYLAKNKMNDELKDKYKNLINDNEYKMQSRSPIHDLYQIFINQLIETSIKGGLIIIPVNFITGKETTNLRNKFKRVYNILQINVYEMKVFENTTQSVITMLFINKSYNNKYNQIIENDKDENEINKNENENENDDKNNNNFNNTILNLYTENQIYKNLDINILNATVYDYFTIQNFKIDFIRYYNIPENYYITHIKINLIDTTNKSICAEFNENPIEHKISDRSFINVCCNRRINEKNERTIIKVFNNKINNYRNNTYSLCLSSYREFSRKRLTISEALYILKCCISNK